MSHEVQTKALRVNRGGPGHTVGCSVQEFEELPNTWAGQKFFQDDVVKVSSVAFGFSGSRSCGTPHKTKEIENQDAIEETCTKKTLSPIDS